MGFAVCARVVTMNDKADTTQRNPYTAPAVTKRMSLDHFPCPPGFRPADRERSTATSKAHPSLAPPLFKGFLD